jgi:hypothetical protein
METYKQNKQEFSGKPLVQSMVIEMIDFMETNYFQSVLVETMDYSYQKDVRQVIGEHFEAYKDEHEKNPKVVN